MNQNQNQNRKPDPDTKNLSGKKIAILATHGFEQSELEQPREALEQAGAETEVISLEPGEIRGWSGDDFGDSVSVDRILADATAEDYDGLLLPGGVMNPDKLRAEPKAVEFVQAFFAAGKPVAAICHGPQLLIEAEVVRGRKLTSYHSVKKDLINAGAKWIDAEVVTDNGLVTSRKPDDIPAFNAKMIEEFAEGRHTPQPAGSGAGASNRETKR
ncbi:MAG: type 1 glutamine amidotransferase domain-containing protein [Verrucomicrobiota bacterium]